MTSRLSIVLILACLLASACQDRQRPKPVTAHTAAAAVR
jgi:hypothetical protein